MIELSMPAALILLPLPFMMWWLAPAYRETIEGLRIPFFRRVTEAVGATPSVGATIPKRPVSQLVFISVAWALVVLALAAPVKLGEPIEIDKSARDVMLAIDISGSMDQSDLLASDGKPVQRLQAVKRVVNQFVEERAGDRVALIVFGSKAFVQAPFTEDLSTVSRLMDQTEVGMAGPHTVIGDALGLAIKVFDNSKIDKRLLILLSDGTDTGSRMTPINAAEIAASRGVEIFTIGVGDPDGTGDQRLDERTLKDIALRANGQYFFAGDETGLRQVYARIEDLAPRKVESIVFQSQKPLAPYVLMVAVALSFLVLIGARKRSQAGGVS